MDTDEIDVINYLDMHAEIEDNDIVVFSIKALKKDFPEIDELSLKAIESEWRKARQTMMNTDFSSFKE